jgi:hypothetical protein
VGHCSGLPSDVRWTAKSMIRYLISWCGGCE